MSKLVEKLQPQDPCDILSLYKDFGTNYWQLDYFSQNQYLQMADCTDYKEKAYKAIKIEENIQKYCKIICSLPSSDLFCHGRDCKAQKSTLFIVKPNKDIEVLKNFTEILRNQIVGVYSDGYVFIFEESRKGYKYHLSKNLIFSITKAGFYGDPSSCIIIGNFITTVSYDSKIYIYDILSNSISAIENNAGEKIIFKVNDMGFIMHERGFLYMANPKNPFIGSLVGKMAVENIFLGKYSIAYDNSLYLLCPDNIIYKFSMKNQNLAIKKIEQNDKILKSSMVINENFSYRNWIKGINDSGEKALKPLHDNGLLAKINDELNFSEKIVRFSLPGTRYFYHFGKNYSISDVKVVILPTLEINACKQIDLKAKAYNMLQKCSAADKNLDEDFFENWKKPGIFIINCISFDGFTRYHKISEEFDACATELIKIISKQTSGVVFMLWGKTAKQKAKLIDKSKHYVLKNESIFCQYDKRIQRFVGARQFSLANQYFIKIGEEKFF